MDILTGKYVTYQSLPVQIFLTGLTKGMFTNVRTYCISTATYKDVSFNMY